MSGESEPLLDALDIQGNILPGFNRRQRFLVAFTCAETQRLQAALAALRPHLTTMADALQHRDALKQARRSHLEATPRSPDLWVNLALSARATEALGATDVARLDDDDLSFSQGMSPGLLGDSFADRLPNGSPNPAHRSNWIVGSPSRRVDLLLIFAHDEAVAERARPLIDELVQVIGAPPVYEEAGHVLDGEIEHFGFRDGISQPGVRGRTVVNGVERLVTTRYGVPSRHGIEFGKPGQPLVWPGQFFTGQPATSDDRPDVPRELINGSFVVFRRLNQDVKAFFDDTSAFAQSLGVTGDHLRALIVGRFPSGGSLMRHSAAPAHAEAPNEINYFEFGSALPALTLSDGATIAGSFADPDVLRGRRCPVWAHTRKVNPRDQGTNRGGPLETIGFQMLRRGIPFGLPFDHDDPANPVNQQDRGLLFISYQRNIARQFSILNHDWMNNRDAPQAGGFDLLVGQNVPDDAGGLHQAKGATFFGPSVSGSGAGTAVDVARQWVIPTGGAFLFAPSLSFVEKFGRP
jgi:Dyp-type peroxidase family